MTNVPERSIENPTTLRSKVVASRSEESRFLRRILAGLVKHIRKKRLWPKVDGDLSSWVFHLHGFKEREDHEAPLESRYKEEAVAASVDFATQLLGPGMDVRRIEHSINQSQKVSDEVSVPMVNAIRSGDHEAFQSLFSKAIASVLDAFEIPPSFTAEMGINFDRIVKSIRAVRATLLCVALYKEHPLALIARASKGDRRAVLDLVKVDNLFLHDCCCTATIRTAELQDDQNFLEQIARALEYEPKLRRRDVQHIYCYILCLLEEFGVTLPTMNELWSTLDPSATQYPTLSAFEKDFQRRRQDFVEMVKAAEAEVAMQSKAHPATTDDAQAQDDVPSPRVQ